MRRLIWLVIAALAGFAAGCTNNKYTPFSFEDFPGYKPSGAKAPADPHRTRDGYVP